MAAHALAVGDTTQVGRVTAAALAQVPGAWVLVGLVVATFGLWPQATAGVWGVLVAFVVVGQFGKLWGVPQLLMDLSPFTALTGPSRSRSAPRWSGGAGPRAVVLLAVGDVAFRRRDLSP